MLNAIILIVSFVCITTLLEKISKHYIRFIICILMIAISIYYNVELDEYLTDFSFILGTSGFVVFIHSAWEYLENNRNRFL